MSNLVLKGFNPDPTMCFANGKYYIATSTFQWYPGITIYESDDLVNFKIISRPLTNDLDFDLKGIDDSGGIWAPNLYYKDGTFYLSYTIVKSITGVYYDMDNYIVTSLDISKGWSKPHQVNSGIFDPSIFIEDEKMYLFGKIVDHRFEPTNNYIENYSGIIVQELDKNNLKQIGEFKVISYGTKIGGEEGPQMFKRNGYYYLNIAEGGTEYNHQTTVLRSKDLFGPFEVHPQNPVLKSNSEDYLQKAGHSSFVCDDNDTWVISHLCARPIESCANEISGKLCCPLGRETAIQEVEWIDDWPYIVGGPRPTFKNENTPVESSNDIDFKFSQLPDNRFLMLRTNMEKYNRIFQNKLIMPGKDSLMSKFEVNLYGTRITNLNTETSITLEYNPQSYLQMSGISLYYDTENYITLFVTYDKKYGKCIKLEVVKAKKYSTLNFIPISIGNHPVTLKFKIEDDLITGAYTYNDIETELDFKYHTSFLSDDYILMKKPAFFTGLLSCFYSSDLTGSNLESKIINYKNIEVK